MAVDDSVNEEPNPTNNNEDFDLNSARQQLESLLSIGDDSMTTYKKKKKTNKDDEVSTDNFSIQEFLAKTTSSTATSFVELLPPPPPLSSIERDRRLAEIQFLKQLEISDESTSELWNLWYSERGQTALTKLQKTDSLMGDPTSWQECETRLIDLIDTYGVYFIEPVNRLATLYYLQGKFMESYQLCRVILQIKPWHFGALSGIVQVCIGMGDRNAARVWAQKRLPNIAAGTGFPPFTEKDMPVNPRRTEWVEKAVQQAKDRMKQAKERTRKSFGSPEAYYKSGKKNQILDNDQDNTDAWQ